MPPFGITPSTSAGKGGIHGIGQQSSGTLKDKGLAGIRLANSQLASDTDNEPAFELLKHSIALLDEIDYLPLSWFAPPEYIHGLYNRGCYAFNNILHQYNLHTYGPAEMNRSTNDFEGLNVAAPKEPDEEKELINQLKEGLPFLERAILLSTGIEDQKLAHIEYLSAKGEVKHALSHLTDSSNGINAGEALISFTQALRSVQAIDDNKYTPQHAELEDKLRRIKLPHLCSIYHSSEDTGPLCQLLANRGVKLCSRPNSALEDDSEETEHGIGSRTPSIDSTITTSSRFPAPRPRW